MQYYVATQHDRQYYGGHGNHVRHTNYRGRVGRGA